MDTGFVTPNKQTTIIHVGSHFSSGSTAQPKLFVISWTFPQLQNVCIQSNLSRIWLIWISAKFFHQPSDCRLGVHCHKNSKWPNFKCSVSPTPSTINNIMCWTVKSNLLTATPRNPLSSVKWYMLSSPPRTRIVISNNWTSTFLARLIFATIQSRATSYSAHYQQDCTQRAQTSANDKISTKSGPGFQSRLLH